MKLAFDFDGVICEGRYIERPERNYLQKYMALTPYDHNTIRIMNRLCSEHEVVIITSRSFPSAAKWSSMWLKEHGLEAQPLSILTHIEKRDKRWLAKWLKCDILIDDAPSIYDHNLQDFSYLMDNPYWQENQELDNVYIDEEPVRRLSSWNQIERLIETRNYC